MTVKEVYMGLLQFCNMPWVFFLKIIASIIDEQFMELW